MLKKLKKEIQEAYEILKALGDNDTHKLYHRAQRQMINAYCEYLYITMSKNAYWNHYKYAKDFPEAEINIIIKEMKLWMKWV